MGFGSRYADGCTSGHAIFGLSNLQFSSLLAVLGFFAGGLFGAGLLLIPFSHFPFFYFREPDLYLIIGSAVLTGMLSLFLIRKFHIKTLEGKDPNVVVKLVDKGKWIGGFIFGLGWFIAGTCPGPIFAQLGTGEVFALFTLLGALLGSGFFRAIRHKLPY